MTDPEQLDDVDRRILARLKTNGREPTSSIAKQVELSAAAVKRRIERLEKRGVIKGYTVAINYDEIGTSIDAYIELSFKGSVDARQAMNDLIERPEVREAIALAGSPDALLRVRVKTTGELGNLAMELRKVECIRSATTHVVIGRWWHGATRP